MFLRKGFSQFFIAKLDWARVFYEWIVNKAQPSWLSLIENEGELSNCLSRNSKGLQSKTYNIIENSGRTNQIRGFAIDHSWVSTNMQNDVSSRKQ